MKLDSAGLEILSRAECLSLLDSVPIGRVAFTARALPAIQPVNFVRDGNTVVIKTGAGSKLSAATRNTVVAFEADTFDLETKAGWSVVIVGHSSVVTNPTEISRLSRLPLQPWTPAARDHFIRITIEEINGRRVPTSVHPAVEPQSQGVPASVPAPVP
jgi:hypothetical protein